MLLLEVPSLSLGDEILRLVVAAGLGGAVGLEREYREREAGSELTCSWRSARRCSRSPRPTAFRTSSCQVMPSSVPTRPGSRPRS
jgi:hypothetical protein